MKSLIHALLGIPGGRLSTQGFYEKVHRLAIQGMNYGNGADFMESGELAAMDAVRRRCPAEGPLTLFDVGSNVGGYAVEMARAFGPRATVHAFEPSQRTYAQLLSTIDGHPGIVPHNMGLSDKRGNHSLYLDKEGSGLGSVYKRDLGHFGISMELKEEISLTTVDGFCAENGIGRIDFLKLDVEGHELSVLHGAERMLSEGAIGAIQFEFGGCNIDSRTFFRDFFNLLGDRYRIHRIVRNGLRPIWTYRESDEVFMTINYMALPR